MKRTNPNPDCPLSFCCPYSISDLYIFWILTGRKILLEKSSEKKLAKLVCAPNKIRTNTSFDTFKRRNRKNSPTPFEFGREIWIFSTPLNRRLWSNNCCKNKHHDEDNHNVEVKHEICYAWTLHKAASCADYCFSHHLCTASFVAGGGKFFLTPLHLRGNETRVICALDWCSFSVAPFWWPTKHTSLDVSLTKSQISGRILFRVSFRYI